MHSHSELTHFAGLDWARDHHDVVIVDAAGRIVADFRFEHTAGGWRLWQEKIAAFPKLGVAVETSLGAAVEQLLASGASVFPVHPASAKRYRERKCASGNKTDHHDGRCPAPGRAYLARARRAGPHRGRAAHPLPR